ncbi:TRAP transporter small permease [Tropicimonas isoalkanivorans]|uniref:TRAP transporter small permease protein n=1 Tax=Tropicimonas isoalkanivorans TaxID=441112 RepID=A0A1I1PJ18_9RHOB|nr:TRAP transporter small permease [Tropicimonas isoalkanivorans]SFD09696.1 Tripartite ATP-independent transporter, DctQ component [Tropicimonas isoalkanivorans]
MLLTLMERLGRLMAILGGLVLTALVLLTCISVLGRGLNTLAHSAFLTSMSEGASRALLATGVGPVAGDFELVEAGVAFAIFAFLPICQLHGGHATVDIFAAKYPRWLNRLLVTLWEVALSAVILLITWRLFVGMEDKLRYGETTFLLQFPVWWAYGASFVAALAASVVAIYCAVARVIEFFTGRSYMPYSEGALH